MSLFSDYKTSLKSFDVEEIIDLLFFRPLSFLFVKLIYPTNITPNQISVVSMIFGLLSGVMFAFGNHVFFMLGGAMVLISNVLDCADGQLARLKKNGTKIGRVIDGFIDYVTGLSIFAGIGIGLSIYTGNYFYVWVLTLAAAGSRILQNMYFDNYRNMYMSYVYDKGANISKEIEEFRRLRESLKHVNGRRGEKFLVDIYIKYTSTQKTATQDNILRISPEEYRKRNKFLLRVWSWLGSTTHLAAVIICVAFNRLDIYLWLTVTVGNVMLLILYLIQRNVINSLTRQ
ncbi:MAG: CDP-alcohol phosphatidyltransferase family protein [Ignavibacteriae bacterium]|nr:CDP-alcohol phosphatidyltransferase family protein [Ignavibacteriota bacterium]